MSAVRLRWIATGFVAGVLITTAVQGLADERPTAMPPSAPASQGGDRELTLSASVFVDRIGPLLAYNIQRGGDLQRVDMAIFCPFDRAMNTMDADERAWSAEALKWTRTALVGKNVLDAHGLPQPQHASCPDEEPGLPPNPQGR
jgi:hypothetical protein